MKNYVDMGDRVAFLIIQDGCDTVKVSTSGLYDVRNITYMRIVIMRIIPD